jgi:hypothetical protein
MRCVHGITQKNVTRAMNAHSLALPSGDAKIGNQQFIVSVTPGSASHGRIS